MLLSLCESRRLSGGEGLKRRSFILILLWKCALPVGEPPTLPEGAMRYIAFLRTSTFRLRAATLSLVWTGQFPPCPLASRQPPILRLSLRQHLWHKDCILTLASAEVADVFALFDAKDPFSPISRLTNQTKKRYSLFGKSTHHKFTDGGIRWQNKWYSTKPHASRFWKAFLN
jgi:hypothetical protein